MSELPKQTEEIINKAKQIEQELTAEPENNEPVEEPVVEEKPTAPEPDYSKEKVDQNDYKERFARFKKHADQEIYKLRQTVQALEQTVKYQKAQIEELEPKAAELEALQNSDVKQKLSEELGDESAKLIDDYVTKVVKPLQSENELLKAKLEALEEATVASTEKSLVEETINRVRQAVTPQLFDTIDNDPRFIDYLENIDPISGRPVKDLIRSALDTGNITYVASVYKDFHRATSKTMYDEAINKVDNTPEPKTEILEQRVMPGSNAATSPQPSTTEKRIWTRGEVKQFYTDLTNGRIKADIAMKIKNDIEQAALEGRIQ